MTASYQTAEASPLAAAVVVQQVEAYMGAARGVCTDLMRAIVSTGLLQFLAPQEQDPAAFVDTFLADPVYMLKVGGAAGHRV
jgi:hypothetical protein